MDGPGLPRAAAPQLWGSPFADVAAGVSEGHHPPEPTSTSWARTQHSGILTALLPAGEGNRVPPWHQPGNIWARLCGSLGVASAGGGQAGNVVEGANAAA